MRLAVLAAAKWQVLVWAALAIEMFSISWVFYVSRDLISGRYFSLVFGFALFFFYIVITEVGTWVTIWRRYRAAALDYSNEDRRGIRGKLLGWTALQGIAVAVLFAGLVGPPFLDLELVTYSMSFVFPGVFIILAAQIPTWIWALRSPHEHT